MLAFLRANKAKSGNPPTESAASIPSKTSAFTASHVQPSTYEEPTGFEDFPSSDNQWQQQQPTSMPIEPQNTQYTESKIPGTGKTPPSSVTKQRKTPRIRNALKKRYRSSI